MSLFEVKFKGYLRILEELAGPDRGAYFNEAFVGGHYSKLQAIKDYHDPANHFVVVEGYFYLSVVRILNPEYIDILRNSAAQPIEYPVVALVLADLIGKVADVPLVAAGSDVQRICRNTCMTAGGNHSGQRVMISRTIKDVDDSYSPSPIPAIILQWKYDSFITPQRLQKIQRIKHRAPLPLKAKIGQKVLPPANGENVPSSRRDDERDCSACFQSRLHHYHAG
ncbi:hypothetical protein GYMLUDRAFT_248553 [Collybiopsis luxurians FD-317 M1]|uniref:Uncharacterized protein n=1 Tax=Collybiopsis luxurians FD-317 M1 TaxID=944289 RepID=A0A0D0CBU2_9AGAR|nr:hypothetical protein GYMLUDRAFT_248553 [Collybiopsis luxurians FD-317 M1]